MVVIYRNLFASLTEFLAKSMERRTRYHLVFDKTERNELMNLSNLHRQELLNFYLLSSTIRKKVFDTKKRNYIFHIDVGSVLGRTMNEELMIAIASPASV